MFRSADPYKLPPRLLATSLFLHASGFVLLCLLGLPISPLHPRRFRAILIAPARLAPERARPVPRARKIPVHARPLLAAPRRILESPPKLIAPVLAQPVFTAPPAPLLEPLPAPLAVSIPQPPPARLTPPVEIGMFERAAAPASAAPPPQQRSLGSTGSFDAAEPPGASAAPRGTSTRVSGFGDSEAASATGPARASIPVSNFGVSNFGDTTVTNPTRRTAPAAPSATIPVEILDKPRPVYTDEARRLNIQGEVLLQVAFDASGQVRVLHIIRGLGHGLDETAMAAARQIHFRPAQREGRPVDSSAVVHIVFQLAN